MILARNSQIVRLIPLMLIGTLLCSLTQGNVIYVDDDATNADVGSDWSYAFNSLQDALFIASLYHKPIEIRVAQGIYKPDIGIGIVPGDRNASFKLVNGVTIKGGYAGGSNPYARDIELYETILSGDLNGDDVEIDDPCDLFDEPTRAENSFNVVTGSGTDTTAVLEGFTVTGGNANSDVNTGGGMYNYYGSPKIIRCKFILNFANFRGGGMYNEYSNPALIDCSFTKNSSGLFYFLYDTGSFGGGMYNYRSSPILVICKFIENIAGETGGGMENYQSDPILINCAFSRNSTYQGGGIFNYKSAPYIVNCSFSGNWVFWGGGGITNEQNCNYILTNCTFSGNRANVGGGIYNNNSDIELINCTFGFSGTFSCTGIALATDCKWNPSHITLKNCIIWGEGWQICNEDGSTINISYSNVPQNQTAVYDPCEAVIWGIGNIDEDPLFAAEGYWASADNPNIIAEPYQLSAVWIEGDYHLKSQAGRWNLNSRDRRRTALVTGWVIDDVTSPCIDAGDPNSDWILEPWPNGERINMGAYGDTAVSSKSQ